MNRTFALAIAATIGTASIASAESYFGIIDAQGGSGIIEVGNLRSEAPGTVEIFRGDRLVGSTTVNAGANYNVRVDVKHPPNSDLTAVLRSGGEVVDTQRIDINRF